MFAKMIPRKTNKIKAFSEVDEIVGLCGSQSRIMTNSGKIMAALPDFKQRSNREKTKRGKKKQLCPISGFLPVNYST
ncbi:hypothetical protein SG34_003530 [Thalassomonas viridans]|uniref:Uncharacterized protein n=1 Tax=Thalassomonas viridans TaxID=137584 RepID=A0AAF0C9P7_9GAMM|nr:hypothetical protein [Thalassomonas viridans]WDE06013.1 hypothetical protein SG34_003530 [Thalassomonas viridans]